MPLLSLIQPYQVTLDSKIGDIKIDEVDNLKLEFDEKSKIGLIDIKKSIAKSSIILIWKI